MKFNFQPVGIPKSHDPKQWADWKWQLRNIKGIASQDGKAGGFSTGATPYYLRLLEKHPCLRPMALPSSSENLEKPAQEMTDPLGEEKHSPTPRLIHRYPDRVLFLVTDNCAVYCRYCTRKRFTGKGQSLVRKSELERAFSYIEKNPGIREVILSGGDPLSLSDAILKGLLERLRATQHLEIIRIASRMPTACPMRLTNSLLKILKQNQPCFLMTHFNHPLELSKEAEEALIRVADSGILMFNQTVLLQKINNHPALIQALMRRLLFLRVKPYYMFQCDPSKGTDHFRTSVENSKWVQGELWGRFSGLALPSLSLDIPGGGGKVGIVPDFTVKSDKNSYHFEGWDKLKGTYINPRSNQETEEDFLKSSHFEEHKELIEYQKEWELLKGQSYGLKATTTT